jgi:hypothetical protein
MIAVQGILVSEDLLEEKFICDLLQCKGACCIEGESGAPVTQEEITAIEENWEQYKSYLDAEGIAAAEQQRFGVVDEDGEWVTPLIGKHGRCAYSLIENGIAKCGLEQAYIDGKTQWRKPISCFLYPARIMKLHDTWAVNYHRWNICKPACECGSQKGVKVYQFLKAPLIQQFGEDWYRDLEHIASQWNREDN